MIAITGATGQLGRLVINHLLRLSPTQRIVASVRNPEKAADLKTLGIQLRRADYNDPASLDLAFSGVEKLLLISSSEVGKRTEQHRNVIAAAKRQQVKLIVYTSLLHADVSPLNLADEHRKTELLIRESGIPFVILRNGWYTENYTASVPSALANKAFYGSAGKGRISSAARSDYAEAAAKVLINPTKGGEIYELAGDESYTLADLAAEISRQSGASIPYVDLPEADYAGALIKAGLPDWLARGLANWDLGASKGGLFDDKRQLSRLIGHPTTPLSAMVKAAIG